MKTHRLCILIALLLVVLPSSALAIGISVPMVYKWEFRPNFQVNVEFRVYNSHPYPVKAAIQTHGSLGAYGNASTNEIMLEPDGVGTFWVSLKLPESIDEGEQRLEITAAEQAPPGMTISASTAVTVYLQVTRPYIGQFMRATLDVPSMPEHKTIPVSVKVENLGSIGVNDAVADVTFYDKEQVVGSIKTGHAAVPAKSSVTLSTVFQSNLTPGVYTAKAVIHGDENVTSAEDTFVIGTKDIVLLDISKELIAGQVNPVRVTFMNRWNDRINNIRAIFLVSPDSTVGWRAAGPSFDLWPWKESTQEFFMNVPAVSPGVYPATLQLMYEESVKNFTVQFNVRNSPTTEAAAKSQNGMNGIGTLWSVRVLFIVLVVVIVLLYMRARRKEEGHYG